MQVLRERIDRDEYVIDPGKVADAIILRLLEFEAKVDGKG